MKIELIRHIFDNDVGYKYKSFEYCCKKLKDNPVIDFVCEYMVDEHMVNDLFPYVSLCHSEDYMEYGEEYHTDNYYRIKYCPFCGEIIEIFVVEETDLSDIYINLQKQRVEMWKKHNKTDSIKEKSELREIVHKLDNKLDWFYQLHEWDGSNDTIGK